MEGGVGDDILYGGIGNDVFIGGVDVDIFVFDFGFGDDWIEDFNVLEDSLFFDYVFWGGGVMDDVMFLSIYVCEDVGNVLVEFGLNVVWLIGFGNENDLIGWLIFGDVDLF